MSILALNEFNPTIIDILIHFSLITCCVGAIFSNFRVISNLIDLSGSFCKRIFQQQIMFFLQALFGILHSTFFIVTEVHLFVHIYLHPNEEGVFIPVNECINERIVLSLSLVYIQVHYFACALNIALSCVSRWYRESKGSRVVLAILALIASSFCVAPSYFVDKDVTDPVHHPASYTNKSAQIQNNISMCFAILTASIIGLFVLAHCARALLRRNPIIKNQVGKYAKSVSFAINTRLLQSGLLTMVVSYGWFSIGLRFFTKENLESVLGQSTFTTKVADSDILFLITYSLPIYNFIQSLLFLKALENEAKRYNALNKRTICEKLVFLKQFLAKKANITLNTTVSHVSFIYNEENDEAVIQLHTAPMFTNVRRLRN